MINTQGSAWISPCERYRYRLSRWWTAKPTGPWCLWVMLNPSTADDREDDQTISTITSKTWHWANTYQLLEPWLRIPDFSGFHVVNLYAWRATDPMELLKAEDPIGPENDQHIQELARDAAMIVAAWGNGPYPLRRREQHDARVNRVCELLLSTGKPIHMLELTNAGHPRHPLYSPAGLLPVVWRQALGL